MLLDKFILESGGHDSWRGTAILSVSYVLQGPFLKIPTLCSFLHPSHTHVGTLESHSSQLVPSNIKVCPCK